MSVNNPDADPEMSLEDVLRQAAENAKLFTSEELTRHIELKHFTAGVSLFYVDPDYPDSITEERPGGIKIRVPLDDGEDN